jgi:hypothetical protein
MKYFFAKSLIKEETILTFISINKSTAKFEFNLLLVSIRVFIPEDPASARENAKIQMAALFKYIQIPGAPSGFWHPH